MTTPLVVSSQDIAESLGVCDSTFRCYAAVSRPLGLPFERVPGPNGRTFRGYHLRPVIEWIKMTAPERATADFERKLYAAAARNAAKLEERAA